MIPEPKFDPIVVDALLDSCEPQWERLLRKQRDDARARAIDLAIKLENTEASLRGMWGVALTLFACGVAVGLWMGSR